MLCDFHKQECTFVQDPQPRKRKVAGDAEKKDCTPKKRYVHANALGRLFYLPHVRLTNITIDL